MLSHKDTELVKGGERPRARRFISIIGLLFIGLALFVAVEGGTPLAGILIGLLGLMLWACAYWSSQKTIDRIENLFILWP